MSSSSTEADLLNRAIPRTDGDDSDSDDENTISFDSIIGETNGGKSTPLLVYIVITGPNSPMLDKVKNTYTPEAMKVIRGIVQRMMDVRKIPNNLKHIVLKHPQAGQDVYVVKTSGRFRFEWPESNTEIINAFGSHKTVSVLHYSSKDSVEKMTTNLERRITTLKAATNSNVPDILIASEDANESEIKRLEDNRNLLNTGVAEFGVMSQLFHRDSSYFKRLYKDVYKIAATNKWFLGLNNGQFLFAIHSPNEAHLRIEDIALGQVDIQVLHQRVDGGPLELSGDRVGILHRPGNSDGRRVVQVKIPHVPFVHFDGRKGIISPAIAQAVHKEDDVDILEIKAQLERDAKNWPCVNRDLTTKPLTVRFMKQDDRFFGKAFILSPSVDDKQILGLGGNRFSPLQELASKLSIPFLSIDCSSFAILRIEIKSYFVNLGESEAICTEMARTVEQENTYYRLRDVKRSFTLPHDVSSLTRENLFSLCSTFNSGLTIDSLGFELFSGSVINVGNMLLSISAATVKEIKASKTEEREQQQQQQQQQHQLQQQHLMTPAPPTSLLASTLPGREESTLSRTQKRP
jgi:hypothetical protein